MKYQVQLELYWIFTSQKKNERRRRKHNQILFVCWHERWLVMKYLSRFNDRIRIWCTYHAPIMNRLFLDWKDTMKIYWCRWSIDNLMLQSICFSQSDGIDEYRHVCTLFSHTYGCQCDNEHGKRNKNYRVLNQMLSKSGNSCKKEKKMNQQLCWSDREKKKTTIWLDENTRSNMNMRS
jgi:hypothetical protein